MNYSTGRRAAVIQERRELQIFVDEVKLNEVVFKNLKLALLGPFFVTFLGKQKSKEKGESNGMRKRWIFEITLSIQLISLKIELM